MNGLLRFPSAARTIELLGVRPGALTVLGRIRADVDTWPPDAEQVNFHLLINMETPASFGRPADVQGRPPRLTGLPERRTKRYSSRNR
jgi:hypothetical protein